MKLENPNKYLTSNRFDVVAKILYAKHYKLDVATNWAEKIYHDHLWAWNKGDVHECDGSKNNFSDFKKNYNQLLNSLINNGFDETISKIPVANREIVNGAHRLGACIALGQEV